jgi:SAM-dependent methyltransferase
MNFNPGIKDKLYIVANTYMLLGLMETIKELILYLLSHRPKDDFDEKYDVSTVYTERLTKPDVADPVAGSYAVHYVPTRECVMRHILNNAVDSSMILQSSFIDLGCGKGRTLMIAAQFPFLEVIGVELSADYHRVAVENLARYRSHQGEICCRGLRAVCANALDFEFPRTNLFIYMYRPFWGPVFKGVVDKLYQFHVSTGHQVLVAYSCPVEQNLLAQHGGFVQRKEFQVISTDYSWSSWECGRRSS